MSLEPATPPKRLRLEHPPAHFAPSGTVALLPGHDAHLTIVRHVMHPLTPAAFAELWTSAPGPTRTRFGLQLRRRQGFFSDASCDATYTFGFESNPNLGEISLAPAAVRAGMDIVRSDVEARFPELDTSNGFVAQINWYANGKAGINYHQDDESSHTNHPIWSITFLHAPEESDQATYRYFLISTDPKGVDVVRAVALQNTDMVVMEGGDFQKKLWHSVPPTTSRKFRDQQRVNVTFRCLSA